MQLKNQRFGSKTVCGFYYFNFERNYDVLNSKSSRILLNKNINFNKNETESKMENHTHTFRETILCFSAYNNRKLKVKLLWVGARKKKKREFFVPFILSKIIFFYICVLSQCIVYWIHIFRTNILLYIKKRYFIQFAACF